jgi:hypothetical protein
MLDGESLENGLDIHNLHFDGLMNILSERVPFNVMGRAAALQ